VLVGRKKMDFLTNELTLSEEQLAHLYSRRWGVEVFSECVKQSYERSKLLSRTPANAKQEIQWTILAMGAALAKGAKSQPPNPTHSPAAHQIGLSLNKRRVSPLGDSCKAVPRVVLDSQNSAALTRG